MRNESQDVTVVIDDGHFNLKGIALNPKSGELIKYVKPSLVMKGHSSTPSFRESTFENDFFADIGGSSVPYSVMEGLPFGQNNMLVDTQNLEFKTDPANCVLVHAMLHHMGLSGQKVKLLCTSPLQRFFHSNGEVNSEYISKRNENLKTQVKTKDGQMVEVVSVEQVPEGFSTYLSLLHNYDPGKRSIKIDTQLMKQDILILDFGGQSLDVAVMVGGKLMSQQSYTEEGVGMLRIHNDLMSYLKSYRRNIDRPEMNRIIETGTFFTDKRQTNEISVQDHVDKVVRDVLSAGIDRVSKRTPFNNFDKIVASGGSAKSLARHLQNLIPEIEFVKDPLFANGEGAMLNHIRVSEIQKKQNSEAPTVS